MNFHPAFPSSSERVSRLGTLAHGRDLRTEENKKLMMASVPTQLQELRSKVNILEGQEDHPRVIDIKHMHLASGLSDLVASYGSLFL